MSQESTEALTARRHAVAAGPQRRRLLHRPAAVTAATLFAAATLLDLAGAFGALPQLWPIAYLALAVGLLTALLALPLGMRDAWHGIRQRVLPPGRVMLHVTPVALALLVYTGAWLVRAHPRVPVDPGTLLMEGIAGVLLLSGVIAGVRLRRRLLRERTYKGRRVNRA